MKNKLLLFVVILGILAIQANAQVFVGESFTLKPPVKSCLNYTWDFGDGTILETEDTVLTHTYEAPGEYSVVLVSEYFCPEEQINKSDTVINSIVAEVNFNNYISYGPNPYSDNCTISYTIPFSCNIHIFVTDFNGIVVTDFVNEYQSAGSYNYIFSAEAFGFPPGNFTIECEVDEQLYFYHIQEL